MAEDDLGELVQNAVENPGLTRRSLITGAAAGAIVLATPAEATELARHYGSQGQLYKDAQVDETRHNLKELAQNFQVLVRRHTARGHKWGWRLGIQEMDPETHNYALMTAINEAWPEGDNPEHLLTTEVELARGDPQFRQKRDDNLSTLVARRNNVDAMTIYNGKPWPRRHTRRSVNNFTEPDYKDGEATWKGSQPRMEAWNMRRELGLDIEIDPMAKPGDPTTHQEQWHMQRWMRAISDPFTVYTIGRIGDGEDGHGLYEIVAYRVHDVINDPETRHPWDVDARDVVLIGHFDYGSGILERVKNDGRYVPLWGTEEPFPREDFAFYSEIYGQVPREGSNPAKTPFWDNLFKIDTVHQMASQLDMTRLENLRDTQPVYW